MEELETSITFKDIPNELLPPARVTSLSFQNFLRQCHRLGNECFRHGLGQIHMQTIIIHATLSPLFLYTSFT